MIPNEDYFAMSLDDNSEIVSVNTSDENTQMLFVDAFLQNNRLDHITHVMGYHPQYLDSFLRTQQFLLRGDGPLPYDYRHYIAIMATARHQCTYLVTLYIQEFILVGGDPTWLKGLSYIPKKLQDIYEVNKILAHRPWLLSSSHIEKLIKADDNWSVSELMHALILLAHFHSLCSFVRGCGINAEIDLDGGYTFRPLSMSESEDSNDSTDFTNGDICDNSYEGSVEHLMKQMREITDDIDEISQDELIKRFESVEHQNAELHLTNAQPSPNQEILKFVDDPQFIYEDFTKRETDIPTFRAQNFSWEEHGFSLANRLYNEIGNLLDEKFRQAYNLTYYTMGDNKDVDTTAFRTAVWNYIHCIFGIRHDDYDYGAINQLLEKNLKAYVKTVTCYPERLSKKDYDLVMREFKHSEKVHVHLMLYEARMQAELLYSLRAVMKYLT